MKTTELKGIAGLGHGHWENWQGGAGGPPGALRGRGRGAGDGAGEEGFQEPVPAFQTKPNTLWLRKSSTEHGTRETMAATRASSFNNYQYLPFCFLY